MKGIQGLLVALALGIGGAIFNFAYLSTRQVESVKFIGIRPEVTIARGEQLTASHVEPVEIPKDHQGNLGEFAFPYSAVKTVIGQNVWRPLVGGSLLLRDDLRTPPTELNFGQTRETANERMLGVPIDTRKFVPSLVVPGDWVSFIVPGAGDEVPTLADDPANPGAPAAVPAVASSRNPPRGGAAQPAAGTDASRRGAGANTGIGLIGPFKVLSLGNRLGSSDVMRAAKMAQVQENVMTILVKVEGDRLDPKAELLMKVLDRTGSQPLSYLLHPRTSNPRFK